MIRERLNELCNLQSPQVLDEDGELSFSELSSRAKTISRLIASRTCDSKCAAIFLSDGADYISALLGVIKAGITAFPLNSNLKKREIFPLLEKAHARTVITSKAFGRIFESLENSCYHVIYIEDAKENGGSADSKFGVSDCDLSENENNKNFPMLYLSTSGSMGELKIVKLSEKSIEASVYGYLDRMNFDEAHDKDIRYILCAPYSSAYGIMIIFACLICGYPLITPPVNFSLTAFYEAVARFKATHYEGGAVTLLLMLQTAGKEIPFDISSLKCLGFGGSKLSGRIIDELQKVYPDKGFFQGYGMTEAAPLIAKHPIGVPVVTESVGKPIKGVEVLIAGGQPYARGEVLVRGENVMLGYLENEEATQKVLKNGWLHTGDVGYLDARGYLYICGRLKNLIIVRGFNVHPEEVANCIIGSGLARDARVYGETCANGSEIVCADIVVADGIADSGETVSALMTYLKENLAEYKLPARIRIQTVIDKGLKKWS